MTPLEKLIQICEGKHPDDAGEPAVVADNRFRRTFTRDRVRRILVMLDHYATCYDEDLEPYDALMREIGGG